MLLLYLVHVIQDEIGYEHGNIIIISFLSN